MGRISLTAFFPAYNDQHTIEPIVRTVADEMRKVTDDFEVLVVNDGSLDKTGEILRRLQIELPFLRVVHHERNLGYGAALITGFKNASKETVDASEELVEEIRRALFMRSYCAGGVESHFGRQR